MFMYSLYYLNVVNANTEVKTTKSIDKGGGCMI